MVNPPGRGLRRSSGALGAEHGNKEDGAPLHPQPLRAPTPPRRGDGVQVRPESSGGIIRSRSGHCVDIGFCSPRDADTSTAQSKFRVAMVEGSSASTNPAWGDMVFIRVGKVKTKQPRYLEVSGLARDEWSGWLNPVRHQDIIAEFGCFFEEWGCWRLNWDSGVKRLNLLTYPSRLFASLQVNYIPSAVRPRFHAQLLLLNCKESLCIQPSCRVESESTVPLCRRL